MSVNEIIQKLNEAYDNLWLGAIDTARDILSSIELSEKTLRKYEDVKRLYKEIKEKYRGNDTLIADRFREATNNREINMEYIISGSIHEYAKMLANKLKLVIEIKEPSIITKKYYKYSISKYLETKYEVRILFNNSVKEINEQKLLQKLKNMNFRVESVPVDIESLKSHYLYISAFSSLYFIELIALLPRAVIIFSFAKSERERIQQICEEVIDSMLTLDNR
ncbi:MAG: hypothetical protein QXK74_08035 [Candidatus Nitrosocaldaceae archaeon]